MCPKYLGTLLERFIPEPYLTTGKESGSNQLLKNLVTDSFSLGTNINDIRVSLVAQR